MRTSDGDIADGGYLLALRRRDGMLLRCLRALHRFTRIETGSVRRVSEPKLRQ
jgi:hypothetical protein